jgi:hypothetical protein
VCVPSQYQEDRPVSPHDFNTVFCCSLYKNQRLPKKRLQLASVFSKQWWRVCLVRDELSLTMYLFKSPGPVLLLLLALGIGLLDKKKDSGDGQ